VDPKTKFGVTGKIDAAKLLPGAKGYYDALARVGNPLGEARDVYRALTVPEKIAFGNSKTKRWKRIILNGAESSSSLVDLRWKDQSTFRNAAVKKIFETENRGETLELKPGRTSNKAVSAWETIDVAKTTQGRPDLVSSLKYAIGQWAESDAATRNHLMAINSAVSAEMGCGCD